MNEKKTELDKKESTFLKMSRKYVPLVIDEVNLVFSIPLDVAELYRKTISADWDVASK